MEGKHWPLVLFLPHRIGLFDPWRPVLLVFLPASLLAY
jgi:hypothetical protein